MNKQEYREDMWAKRMDARLVLQAQLEEFGVLLYGRCSNNQHLDRIFTFTCRCQTCQREWNIGFNAFDVLGKPGTAGRQWDYFRYSLECRADVCEHVRAFLAEIGEA